MEDGVKLLTENISVGGDAARYIGAALAIGLGGLGVGIGLGTMFSRLFEAIGRNPEATSKLQVPMFLGAAFTEAIAIYALVVALAILFK